MLGVRCLYMLWYILWLMIGIFVYFNLFGEFLIVNERWKLKIYLCWNWFLFRIIFFVLLFLICGCLYMSFVYVIEWYVVIF